MQIIFVLIRITVRQKLPTLYNHQQVQQQTEQYHLRLHPIKQELIQ